MSASRSRQKPWLLLDVDGVVIPFGRIDALSLTYPMLGTDSEYVRHDPNLPEWLTRLRERFEIVWATAWEDQANAVLVEILGLPPLPVIRFDDDVEPGLDYKLPAIQRFVGDRPCAWVDDAIGFDAHAWAAERRAPTLFLDIRADRGLTETDFQALLTFAEQSTESEAR